MTQAGAPRPDPADDEVIDDAVRERLGALLDLGADWMGRDLLGRVDPLSLLPALARTGWSVAGAPDQARRHPDRGAATAATKAGLGRAGPRPGRHPRVRAAAGPGQAIRRPDLERERRVLAGSGSSTPSGATALLRMVGESGTNAETKRKAGVRRCS